MRKINYNLISAIIYENTDTKHKKSKNKNKNRFYEEKKKVT